MIAASGSAYAWGNGDGGVLGINDDSTNPTTPVVIGSIQDADMCAAGYHTFIRNKDKSWQGFGPNSEGQVTGDGTTSTSEIQPVASIADGKTFDELVARSDFSVGRVGGVVWTWGVNTADQLGRNAGADDPTPAALPGSNWVAIAATNSAGASLDTNGVIHTWGTPTHCGRGSGATTDTPGPVVAAEGSLPDFAAIAGSPTHFIALDVEGRVWAWGINTEGVIGDETTTTAEALVRVDALDEFSVKFSKVAASSFASYALSENGRLFSWGNGKFGRLGHVKEPENKPQEADTLFKPPFGSAPPIIDIAVGETFVLLAVENGAAATSLIPIIVVSAGAVVAVSGFAFLMRTRSKQRQNSKSGGKDKSGVVGRGSSAAKGGRGKSKSTVKVEKATAVPANEDFRKTGVTDATLGTVGSGGASGFRSDDPQRFLSSSYSPDDYQPAAAAMLGKDEGGYNDGYEDKDKKSKKKKKKDKSGGGADDSFLAFIDAMPNSHANDELAKANDLSSDKGAGPKKSTGSGGRSRTKSHDKRARSHSKKK